jgi:hypothetical protein
LEKTTTGAEAISLFTQAAVASEGICGAARRDAWRRGVAARETAAAR